MHYTSFKKAVLDYCEIYDINQPNKKTLIQIWGEYEESLFTAPVEDNDITLGQFLDSYYGKMRKNPYFEVPKGTLSFADFNRACVALSAANVPCPPQACVKVKCKANKEEENSMAYEKTDTAVQRDYFTRRLTEARYVKENELGEMFRLRANPQPRNFRELIDFVKNGKFEIDTKRAKYIDAAIEDNEDAYFNTFDGIKWTGRPAPDFEGYSAAEKEMYKREQTAKDAIMTNPADGAKAVAEFEAWTPVGKSN